MPEPPGRLAATQFSEKELRSIIAMLAAPRGKEGTKGRFDKLHELIEKRDQHFYATAAADQLLAKPHEDVQPYQSDIIRRTWVQLKARLVENPFRVRAIAPNDKKADRKDADLLETVLQRGFELMEQREGFSIQADLADGQILHCYGVLHWQRATDVWPKFEGIEEDETAGEALEDDRHAKARAGFPYYVEVIRPDLFAFVADRGVKNGLGWALVLRNTPLIEYSDRLRNRDQIYLSVNASNDEIMLFEEHERPADDDPSVRTPADWGANIQVAQFWTRDEFYELVARNEAGADAGGWQVVKSFKHAWGMPPFALAHANRTNHPDPALAYRPMMDGLYRLKPFYDKDVTLGRAIAEQIALPMFWIKLPSGEYMTRDDGTRAVLSRNALTAEALPAGATLEKVDFELNPAFIDFLKLAGEELHDSAPETGFVEVGASTQPWTIRLAQDQANAEISAAKREQGFAIRTAVRSIVEDMGKPRSEGGFGQTVWVYARTEDGKVLSEDAVGIEPEKILTLEIEVDINPHSGAQTIANIEHERTWVSDPLMPFDQLDMLEDGLADPHPDLTLERYQAREIWRTRVMPGVIEQKLAERFGDKFVVTPGGSFVGMNGQETQLEAVLAAAGLQVVPLAPTGPGGGANGSMPGVPGEFQAESAATPGDLAPITAPGTEPLPGQGF